MNYLWAGLILISFLFALGTDANELRTNRYRNNIPLAVEVAWPSTPADGPAEQVTLAIPQAALAEWAGRPPATTATAATQIKPITATVVRSEAGGRAQLHLQAGPLPAELAVIRKFHDADEKLLIANLRDSLPSRESAIASTATLRVTFEPVRFARLRAINDAAVTFAQTAFTIVIGLVGGLTLWLGLLKIAEDSGLVNLIVRVIRPLIGPLFPGVPKESPALGLITLNVAANMLALGNAATPIGIKAMQELQKLNPVKDTATNAMVMLLAINTAGVTLLPSPTLVGIMGPRIGSVMGPIIATTGVALAIAIVTAKLFERFGRPVPIPETTPDSPRDDDSPRS